MAPEKSPAFQFYPKDYLADPRVRAMSFDQRGLYWEAICICWLEGTLPVDRKELASILGCPIKKFDRLWPRIAHCFQQHGERLAHKRLDRERQAQSDSRDRRAEAARKRWEKEHGTGSNADAMQMQSNAGEPSPVDAKQCSPSPSPSPSPSSTPSPTPVKREGRTAVQGSGAFEPGSLPRDHMRHTLCGPLMRICLLSWQYDALAKAYNAPENPHGTRAVIAQFIEQLESGLTPESSIGRFSDVEKEFHTYLKTIGRVPPKITAIRDDAALDAALAEVERKAASGVRR